MSLIGCKQFTINDIPDNGITKSAVYFDTLISITIYNKSQKDADPILDNCINLCNEFESLFNNNIPTSDIARINTSNGKETSVDSRTSYLVNKAQNYSKSTNGLFDISIYSVSKLWDFHQENPIVPNVETIKKALAHVNYNNINCDIDSNIISLNDPDAQIDIGGIAKGYIADELSTYLIQSGITSAIINIGGDMKLIGSKNNNTPFTIGINDPSNSGLPIMALQLSSCAVATSGTYERSFTLGDTTYHHILDPHTGYPVNTDLVSSTVITSSSIDADTICTIAILLGSNDALNYINNTADCEAILITGDGSILTTNGADKYIKH